MPDPSNVISVDFGQRERCMDTAWKELISAVAALKDSERHLLRTHAALTEITVAPMMLETLASWAKNCEIATEACSAFIPVLGDELGYEDPFSSPSGSKG